MAPDSYIQANRFHFYWKLAGNYSFVRGSTKSASKASRGLTDLPDWRSMAHFLTASNVNLTTEGCCVAGSVADGLAPSDAAACSRSIISSRFINFARFISSPPTRIDFFIDCRRLIRSLFTSNTRKSRAFVCALEIKSIHLKTLLRFALKTEGVDPLDYCTEIVSATHHVAPCRI
jgi:hypothetical protein